MTDYMYESLDNDKVCAVNAWDLQKAFDSVNRDILVNKFSWYDIECKVIEQLVCNRSQYVEINGKSLRKN